MGIEPFDPVAWLARANRCLCKMGAKQRQSATIGIVLLGARTVTYWSAGHVPLFIASGSENRQVRKMSPLGNVVGHASEDFVVGCRTIELPPGPATILLGTDGVFSKGLLHTREEILALVDGLRARGEAALFELPTPDDKALVRLELAA
jgi:serine phosphatase RsbU (regulator of sigma subunit)